MIYKLIVEPEAEAEIDEAARWYDANGVGRGAQFLRAVEAGLDAIQRNPFQYQIVYRQVRRAGLRRSPYGLMYIVLEEGVIVIACFHGRRNPKVWQERSSRHRQI